MNWKLSPQAYLKNNMRDRQYVREDTKFYLWYQISEIECPKDEVSVTKSIPSLNFAHSLDADPRHPLQQQ
jgi:hypothetical protein